MLQPSTQPRSSTIPFVSGVGADGTHFEEFCEMPVDFLMRAHQECGELAEFDQGGILTVLMVGPEAQEAVFRAPDEQLSAALAYQYMVPVFGKGVQYGAPLEIERQQLRMHSQGLRAERMSFYAPIIAQETAEWIGDWGESGEMDFYEGFADLTIKTSTHCLLGPEFRYTLTDEFAKLYHDLGAAVDASGTVDHGAQKEAYERRDEARARLGELIQSRIDLRRAGEEEYDDLLAVYMNSTYTDGSHLTDEQIAGMIVWFMFAGHHTSANTAAWTLVELARHPELCREVVREIDEIHTKDPEFGFRSLRKMPKLEGFIREILRAHPPLNTLSRRVVTDFEYKGHVIEAGKNVMVSPYVSHHLPEYFPNPDTFDPSRPQADTFAYIPFGGGSRKCVGNAFAILQVKRIFCELLRNYEFELAGPPETYKEIMPSLILRPSDPCILRYKRRKDV